MNNNRRASSRMSIRTYWGAMLLLLVGAVANLATAADPPRFEFNRLVAHWTDIASPDYLKFIDEAQPQVAQVGFYGAHFYSLVHTPSYKGYPAHFPIQGIDECGAFFDELNRQLHRRGVRVVGHFNVKFLVGEIDGPEGPRGFFKYYRDLWNEQELGPKPVADPLDFLEVNRDGTPIKNNSYNIGKMPEYWACLNNPHWRAVLKAWAKRGIARGVDGYIANYFYRHDCHCRHCVAGFKEYLRRRHTPEQLARQFQIADLASHQFGEIVCWHKPEESTPLRREMLRWSQIANKQAFDEVFVDYARRLKPDLLVAQWDHLGNFNQINGDERCLLPAELWGKNEDYLWYSSGAAAHYSDLKNGFLGDITLQARYIRGAFDDKPFTIGKYESTRTRMAIAELAANGGAPMGFYTRFTDPLARQEIVRYYQFLKRYDELYHANRSFAEVRLLYPRRAVHEGNVEPLARFREIGGKLLDRHVLFDVCPDDLPRVGAAEKDYALTIDPNHPTQFDPDLLLREPILSRFRAPQTVRVSASRSSTTADDLVIHLVNYNRTEPDKPKSAGNGLVDEKPIAVDGIVAEIRLPAERRAASVEFITPEEPDPVALKYDQVGRCWLKFEAPKFLVYGVVRVRLTPEGK